MGNVGETEEREAQPGADDLRADARRNVRRVLEAAARVLAEDPAASVQEIADEAQVSRPTVYRHFSSREELIEAIHQEAMILARETLDAAATSDEPAAAALERLIGDLAAIVARYPLLATMVGPPHKPADHKPPEELARTFDALTARGRRDGTLRRDLRGEVLGPTTMGALLMSLKVGRFLDSDPHDVGAEVAAIVLGGARAGEADAG